MDKVGFDPSTITATVHPNAIYTSRLLKFTNLPQPVNSNIVTIIRNNNCNYFWLFIYNSVVFKRWMISLILKIIKFHFDDYFWLFIFIILKCLIDYIHHVWSMRLHHHVQACSDHKVSSCHFWSCNTTFLQDRKKVRKMWNLCLQLQKMRELNSKKSSEST